MKPFNPKDHLVSSLSHLLKCDRCGNYRTVGRRCKVCGHSTVENGRQPTEDSLAASEPQRSVTNVDQSEHMKLCSTCSQWRHHARDFVRHDRICNACVDQPGFSDQTYLSARRGSGPSVPVGLERETSTRRYDRPAGAPLRPRRPSVTTFGYEAWVQAVEMFAAMEHRWELWGARLITLHDVLSKKQSHELVRTDLSPPPLCDACSDLPARYACPTGLLMLECLERHFACEECHQKGFNNHRGVLGGKDREYVMTVLRGAFDQADLDQSGALDFLESICFFYVLASRATFFKHSTRVTVHQIAAAYQAYADPDGITVENMAKLLKEAFRVMPDNLESIFATHVGSKTAKADVYRMLWVMYHVARPQSPHLKHVTLDEKLRQQVPEPQIEYAPEEAEEPTLAEVPAFVKSKCRVLQMLGQGGMSVIWLVEYEGVKLAAKVPKAGIKPRHKKEMFAAARVQALIKHPNVLRVLGVFEDASWPCMLLELAEAGDLTEWQVGQVDRRMQWRALMEVAQGMAALHSCSPALIHRDLKGQNVFLTKGGRAKVADFDFVAKVEPPTYVVKGICGTPGFMAPEMLAEHSYDVKVDVFSYGSLLYEITHKTFPFSKELQDRSSLTMEDWFELAGNMTLDGIRPRLDPGKTSPDMLALITRCWDGEPFARPSMIEVCGLLSDLREEFINFKPKRR